MDKVDASSPVVVRTIAQLIAGRVVHDVIVLAGKGHEDYQEINGQRHAFSDLVEADHALTAWEVAHA